MAPSPSPAAAPYGAAAAAGADEPRGSGGEEAAEAAESSGDACREPGGHELFAATVRPILEERCRPCHFEGGVMYAKLPFDRERTILDLGEALFTRIKDEPSREAIRALLARRGEAAAPAD